MGTERQRKRNRGRRREPPEEFSFLLNNVMLPGIGLTGDREHCLGKAVEFDRSWCALDSRLGWLPPRPPAVPTCAEFDCSGEEKRISLEPPPADITCTVSLPAGLVAEGECTAAECCTLPPISCANPQEQATDGGARSSSLSLVPFVPVCCC